MIAYIIFLSSACLYDRIFTGVLNKLREISKEIIRKIRSSLPIEGVGEVGNIKESAMVSILRKSQSRNLK